MKKYRREIAFGELKGYSCAYRNWNGESYDEESVLLHGYSLSFFVILVSNDLAELDKYARNNISWMEQYLETVFRNTTLVAKNDPALEAFEELEKAGACELRTNDAIGGLEFSRELFKEFAPIIKEQTKGTIALFEVKVRENGNANYSNIDMTALEDEPSPTSVIVTNE